MQVRIQVACCRCSYVQVAVALISLLGSNCMQVCSYLSLHPDPGFGAQKNHLQSQYQCERSLCLVPGKSVGRPGRAQERSMAGAGAGAQSREGNCRQKQQQSWASGLCPLLELNSTVHRRSHPSPMASIAMKYYGCYKQGDFDFYQKGLLNSRSQTCCYMETEETVLIYD